MAGQVLVLQLVLVALLVAVCLAIQVLEANRFSYGEARARSLSVAEAFAHAPGTVAALRSANPTAELQGPSLAAQHAGRVDFIVLVDTHGRRYTSGRPGRIGRHFVGTVGPALHGHQVVETAHDSRGAYVQAIVPAKAGNRVVGLVSAGVTMQRVDNAVWRGLPLLLGGIAAVLLITAFGTWFVGRRLRRQTHGLDPAEMTRMYEHHDAMLHAVREGVLITDGRHHVVLVNQEARRLLSLGPGVEGRDVRDLPLGGEVTALLAAEGVVTDEVVREGGRSIALSSRPAGRQVRAGGRITTLRDYTELRALAGVAEAARARLDLLYRAGTRIGTSLDVDRTAEELADVTVPHFADYTTVDLAEGVRRGDEPHVDSETVMERVALSGTRADHPLMAVGDSFPLGYSVSRHEAVEAGVTLLTLDLDARETRRSLHPGRAEALREFGMHSAIVAPLRARGVHLGVVSFWRADRPEAFDEDDRSVAEELVGRAAISIDNARRFTREHTLAVTLQRSLLPGTLPEQNALEVASRYLPAEAGVGGDWFDVIPLSGARVALVVGDVVGHGLHAAATMGRLRAAVHNLAALDLPPDELLGHIDSFIASLEEASEDDAAPLAGATCLYAVYDPSTGRCTMARAGHPPPALLLPDGSAVFADVPAGLPLGVGDLPFEAVETDLPAGTQLILYTDGLVRTRAGDVERGLERLRGALERIEDRESPALTCQTVLDALLPERARDDVALMVARTRVLDPHDVVTWDLPPEPAAVARVRTAVTERLDAWGLAELAFATELIVSELATNAMRHAGGGATVRLVRDRFLICEVADGSSTSPHLRYAATSDEGGRGLFLIAQMTERWGTRYTAHGKVIWTEQPLPPAP